jgi:hypothetical protein
MELCLHMPVNTGVQSGRPGDRSSGQKMETVLLRKRRYSSVEDEDNFLAT